MKTCGVLGVAIAVAVVMAGCTAANEPKPADSEPVGNNRPAASASESSETKSAEAEGSTAEEPTEAKTEESPADDEAKPFGSSWVWDDGLAVTISKPKDYKPGEWAFGTEGFKKFVVFDVTVVNKTAKSWDPGLFHATLQSGNEEASEIFESGKLKERPSTKLLKGREVTFQMAFGVKDPADLVLEVTPDFEHNAAMYQS